MKFLPKWVYFSWFSKRGFIWGKTAWRVFTYQMGRIRQLGFHPWLDVNGVRCALSFGTSAATKSCCASYCWLTRNRSLFPQVTGGRWIKPVKHYAPDFHLSSWTGSLQSVLSRICSSYGWNLCVVWAIVSLI